jgi:hypothetical protein
VDIADAVYSLLALFLGAPSPPCLEACDANDDGAHDVSDALFVLGYLFLGGPAPGPGVRCESTSVNCEASACE